MKVINESYFIEASNSRIYSKLSDNADTCAIISPYRSEYSEKENKQRMTNLKSDVRKLGYGFNQLVSRWVEDGEAFDEQSLFIPDISYKEAYALSTKYNQSSFIFKDDESCREICTTAFETFKPGETVRTYFNSGDHVFNFDDAKAVFSKRVGGPASKLIKGSNSQPFQFHQVNEVYEVIPPKPSYFQTEYSYKRIL